MNAAQTLYEVVENFNRVRENRITSTWERLLDAPYGSRLFIDRWGVLVDVVSDVGAHIDEGGRGSEVYTKYLPAWFGFIVFPNVDWNARPEAIAGPELDLLSSFIHLLEATVPAATIETDLISRLQGECTLWVDELFGPVPGLAEDVRIELLYQFEHLLWLLENSSRFGTAPIVKQAELVVGKAIVDSSQFDEPEVQKHWLGKLAGLVSILVLVSGYTQTGAQAIEGGVESADKAIKAVVQVFEGSSERDDDLRRPESTGSAPHGAP